MKSYKLDMVQYDCPYIRTSEYHDVAFQTQHWDFNHADRTLETRLVVVGADREELNNGLDTLSECEMLRGYELLEQKGDIAVIRSEINETDAMRSIRSNDGYVTGPFLIREGSEIWHVGFDTSDDADEALSELDRNNEFEMESEESIGIDEFGDVIQNANSLHSLLTTLQGLTETERETLEAAVTNGYFQSPRQMSLEDLSDEFSISKMGASKNLRRSQRKVLKQIVTLLNNLEAQSEMLERSSQETNDDEPFHRIPHDESSTTGEQLPHLN